MVTRPFSFIFDEDFEGFIKSFFGTSGENYSNYNFPPADIFVDKDKNLNFEFALAGYNKDLIDVSFSGGTMVLKVDPVEKPDKAESKNFSRAIRKSGCINKYNVPSQVYDVEKATASFNEGILTVFVPSKKPDKATYIKIK